MITPGRGPAGLALSRLSGERYALLTGLETWLESMRVDTERDQDAGIFD